MSGFARRGFLSAVGVGLLGGLPRLEWPGPGAPRQAPLVSVRATGAKGDGRRDDTAAIQRAIDALPTAGGTVVVPPGRYMVDAERSVRLRSGLTLAFEPSASFEALPTTAGNSAVLLGSGITGATILGAKLVGGRERQLGREGEWGMGIALRGCREVLVEGAMISSCWGDGIYLGHSIAAGTPGGECARITVRTSTLRDNRRQGMSVTGCTDLVIDKCSFLYTQGTPPSAGIDFEPNAGKTVDGAVVIGSRFEGNAGWGMLAGGSGVSGLYVARSTFVRNGLGAIRLSRTVDSQVRFNTIELGGEGVAVRLDGGSTRNTVLGNVVTADGHPVRGDRSFVQAGGAHGNRLE